MTDEMLLESAVIAILSSDDDLAALVPRPGMTEDAIRKLPLLLTVEAVSKGRSIRLVGDYEVKVTLSRVFRSDTADLSPLWKKALAVLASPPAGLPIYAEFSQLTFDDIDATTDAVFDGDRTTRSVSFAAWMEPAS